MTNDQKQARAVFAQGGFAECFADNLSAEAQKKVASSTPLEAYGIYRQQLSQTESATDGGIPVPTKKSKKPSS